MRRPPAAVKFLATLLATSLRIAHTSGYHRKPCTRSVRSQFQLSDCYVPSLQGDLLFSQASFVTSHNAATGYLKAVNLVSTYGKNQIGTAYDQLNNGARALDLRPKLLANGTTVALQHGSIHIPVSLLQLVQDAIRWCNENQDELVLLLPSNLVYESCADTTDGAYVTAMQRVLDTAGVAYLSCTSVYGLTVAQVMELSQLQSGGYLLVLESQDSYATPCYKSNWISQQVVTCYSYLDKQSNMRNGGTTTTTTRVISNVQCTDNRSNEPLLQSLKQYAMESANNEATNDAYTLGPPADEYNTPLNEIQALWQVDTAAVTNGLSHFSTLLEDNRRSRLNEAVVSWVYSGAFDQISLLAVDNVALYGNALLSVTRNTCGQSTAAVCGTQIDAPRLTHVPLQWYVNELSLLLFLAAATVAGRKLWLRHRREIETALLRSQYVV